MAFFDRARLVGERGLALARLGRPADAQRVLEAAFGSLNPEMVQDQAAPAGGAGDRAPTKATSTRPARGVHKSVPAAYGAIGMALMQSAPGRRSGRGPSETAGRSCHCFPCFLIYLRSVPGIHGGAEACE